MTQMSANTERPYSVLARFLSSNFLFDGFVAAAILVVGISHPQLLLTGIVVGCIYAMGALGLTLIYGLLRFPNIAHGLVMMLGGYLAYFFYTGGIRRSAIVTGDVYLPITTGMLPGARESFFGFSFGYGLIIATMLSGAALGAILIVIDQFVFKPMRRRGGKVTLSLTILSFGVAYILFGATAMAWGTLPRNLIEGIHPTFPLAFGLRIKADQIFIVLITLVTTLGSYALLYWTTFGRSVRAITDNPDLARISGIKMDHVIRLAWMLAGILAAVGGTSIGLQVQLNPSLGLVLILPLFTAVALGGAGNPGGALVGGLAIGIAQELAVAYVSSSYKTSVAFVLLVLLLILRPTTGGARKV